MNKPKFKETSKPYKNIQIAFTKENFKNIIKSEDEKFVYILIPANQALRLAKNVMFLKENSKDFNFQEAK